MDTVDEGIKEVEKIADKYDIKLKPLDEDKLLNNIICIREVKERINDCKAELAQLENEYKALRQEIIDQL